MQVGLFACVLSWVEICAKVPSRIPRNLDNPQRADAADRWQCRDLASRAAHASVAPGEVVELEQTEHPDEPDFRHRGAFFEICYPAGLRRQPNLVRSIRTAWKLQMAA